MFDKKDNNVKISIKEDEALVKEVNDQGETVYRVVKINYPRTWDEVLKWHCKQLGGTDAFHGYRFLKEEKPKMDWRLKGILLYPLQLKMVIEALNDGWVPIAEDSNRYYPYIRLGKLETQKSCGEGFLGTANLFRAVPSWLYLKDAGKCEHLIKYFPNLVYKYYGELVGETFDK